MLHFAILSSLMVWGVVESNLRFFQLSVVPDTGSVAMEVTVAQGVAVAVFSNFSFTSFELICDAGVQNPLFFSKYSPIDLLIILYLLTMFEASSCYSFRDIMNTNFQSPNLQREIIPKKIK